MIERGPQFYLMISESKLHSGFYINTNSSFRIISIII